MSAQREPAVGCRRTAGGMRQVIIRLDDDTFDEVRARAVKEGTSFGEQVRLLVTWGLEDAKYG